jgi:hypothetical protein
MLPFSDGLGGQKRALSPSEHGVVTTGKHGYLLGGCFVEGHVRLLVDPDKEIAPFRNLAVQENLWVVSKLGIGVSYPPSWVCNLHYHI